ncbi:DoxX family protein [Humisphaera borealis]|uniref:DoxX family protein n=1 Tax=Humisphaera borealis TaxID=2807512 RepID=A0A7M2WY00_9BACT|nr:DoxX family protein [Humisphaera borealis]QOV90378.1 DoxX family protein [Humisphaera borealis]
MNERRQGILTSIGLLIIRIGMGGFMMTHGYAKLEMLVNGQTNFPDPLGMGGRLSLICATGAEFFCAFLVALGLLTRIAALPVAFTMGVAAFVIHANDPWTLSFGNSPASKELALLYFAAFLGLVFTGPGWFSLDALVYPYLSRRRSRKHSHTLSGTEVSQRSPVL